MAFNLLPFSRKKNLPARHNGGGDPFDSLQHEMNRLFEDFQRGFDLAPFQEEMGNWIPRVNVSETENEVQVTAELPGMTEKDIDVSLNNDLLTIKGEKKEEREEKDKNFHRRECSCGSFMRTIELPTEVQSDKTQAKFKNGMLSITLPKNKQAQTNTRKIAVSA